MVLFRFTFFGEVPLQQQKLQKALFCSTTDDDAFDSLNVRFFKEVTAFWRIRPIRGGDLAKKPPPPPSSLWRAWRRHAFHMMFAAKTCIATRQSTISRVKLEHYWLKNSSSLVQIRNLPNLLPLLPPRPSAPQVCSKIFLGL
jgi:hypothetical protein